MISFSAPGKIHILGEHAVVYGKPALLTTVGLRVTVTICHPRGGLKLTPQDYSSTELSNLKKIIEPIIKKNLKISRASRFALKTIPPYQLTISSQIPIGSGLGSSAAISAAYIATLLSFLKVKWDLNLINNLTFEAEKIFHGNPSGGDNSTVVYGRLVWFRKEAPDLKIIQPIPFSIPKNLAKNFVLINTGKPEETTKETVELVRSRFTVHSSQFQKIFNHQEQLVKDLLFALQTSNKNQLIQIIKAGEKNLEGLGVVSPFVQSIIRKIEKIGGAAKICGGGGKTKGTGILLCYHPKSEMIATIAKSYNLDYFKTTLGVQGLRSETI